MGIATGVVYLRLFIRLLIGLILLSVSVSKMSHPRRFQRGIHDYQVLPRVLESRIAISTFLSYCIPLAELLAGLGLISGFLLVPTIGLTLGLFVLFSYAILINLIRGRHDLSCHCAGVIGDHRISWWLIARNSLLIVSLLVLLLTPPDIFTFEMLLRSPSLLNSVLFSTVLPVALLVGAVLAALVLVNYARVLWNPGPR
ncbi:MAG: MauE/DoxX family redox-associated membrane protein [Ktedonobacteraceae bacterium]